MNALTLAASYGMKFSFGKVRHVQSITKITSHTQMICEICHALSTLFQPPPLRSERLYVTFHSVFSYFFVFLILVPIAAVVCASGLQRLKNQQDSSVDLEECIWRNAYFLWTTETVTIRPIVHERAFVLKMVCFFHTSS